MFRRFGVLLLLFIPSLAVSIDNDIIGEPDIECLDEEIRVHVKTRKIFAGRIYAKGKAELEECSKNDFHKEKTTKPRFDLQFGVCGMRSMRSVDPRGMYYGITVVVSFHPEFITKVDQAFHVKCFFEEASKGLTAELGVSMLPVNELEARHGIPGCSYTVHKSSIDELDAGRPAGPPIRNARVGDRVLHQWHCNDKMFGILINNCYVTDGFGKKADVIDSHGCPIDPLLITGIRYSNDLQRAYAESQVFKFADKPGVWFFCQVQMCMKKAGMCKNVSPPPCALKGAPGTSPDPNELAETSEGDYEYSTSPPPIPSTATSEYGDYSENTDLKLHSPQTYNKVTPAVDYEMRTDAATVFGPAYNLDSTMYPVTQTSERVSQSFETLDDLKTTTPSKPGKNDYNDYDEVTIPPNLTDLLANLPDDLNADSLQRMFRDSVDDRKALLEGFELLKKQMKTNRKSSRIMRELRPGNLRRGDKITQIESEWSTKRRRDVSPPLDSEEKPMIAGQLLIFDLDEEPRAPEEKKVVDACAISKGGLLAVAGGLGAICATLFCVALAFYVRLSRKEALPSDEYPSKYGGY